MTSDQGQSRDALGRCVAARTVVLPRVRIGGYEITNLPTTMLDNDARLFSPSQRSNVDEDQILGNSAFVKTVLTVDYKNSIMIIWPSHYDFTKQHRREGDRVLEMGWTTSYSHEDWMLDFYGTPAIRVSLAGGSFWCMLDTGWGDSDFGIANNFVKHHPSLRLVRHDKTRFNARHSAEQVERLHDLKLTIPCLWPPSVKPISMTLNGLVTPTLDRDDEKGSGVIGLALMERYRITIDYGRGRVLLEPYVQSTPGQKQEKTHPTAKQTGI